MEIAKITLMITVLGARGSGKTKALNMISDMFRNCAEFVIIDINHIERIDREECQIVISDSIYRSSSGLEGSN